jgi:hypothetical protein
LADAAKIKRSVSLTDVFYVCISCLTQVGWRPEGRDVYNNTDVVRLIPHDQISAGMGSPFDIYGTFSLWFFLLGFFSSHTVSLCLFRFVQISLLTLTDVNVHPIIVQCGYQGTSVGLIFGTSPLRLS